MAQELAGEKLIERSIYIFGIAEALHLAGLFLFLRLLSIYSYQIMYLQLAYYPSHL